MSDLTYEQIEAEFQRQCRLCSGIGPSRQLEIVAQEFNGAVERVGDGKTLEYVVKVTARFPFTSRERG